MATHLQSRGAATTTADGSLAFTNNVVAGSLLVFAIREGASNAAPTVTDSLGSTWMLVQTVSGGRAHILCAVAPSGGPCTITWDAINTASSRVVISEFGGTWPSDPRELTTTPSTFTSSPHTTATLTRVSSNSGVFFSVVDTNGDTTSPSVDADFTYAVSGVSRIFSAYRLSSGAEAQNCTWTLSLSNSNSNNSLLVSFVESGGEGGTTPRRRSILRAPANTQRAFKTQSRMLFGSTKLEAGPPAPAAGGYRLRRAPRGGQ